MAQALVPAADPGQPPAVAEPEVAPPKHHVVVCGGGPAGMALLIRATRLGFWSELVDKGVVVVDACVGTEMGGGRLVEYIIRSNTFARNFVTNVTADATTNLPPEVVSGTALEGLRVSAAGQQLLSLGNEPVALELVGQYLREAGNVLVRELRQQPPAAPTTCMSETEILSVHQRADGTFNTIVLPRGRPRQELHSKHAVLALGGGQTLSSITEADVPTVMRPKLFLSDNVLRQAGFRRLQTQLSVSRRSRVCIVGGSHSAMSVAWLLLNPPEGSTLPAFSPRDITIIHNSSVRVFYPTRREAEADGYTDFSQVNRHDMVHPYGGLRGDAKALYKAIRSGKEGRVKMYLIKRGTGKPIIRRLMEEAGAIVWACGYESNEVPVYDAEGQRLTLKRHHGLVQVDEHAQVLLASGAAVPGLYGIGLGYGLRADLDGYEGNADGVAVYQKRAATLVLSGLIGPQVFGEGCGTWEERQAKQEARSAAKSRPHPDQLQREQREAMARLAQPALLREGEAAAAASTPLPASPAAVRAPAAGSGTVTPPAIEERRKSLQDAHVARLAKAEKERLAAQQAAAVRCPYDGCERAFGPSCSAKPAEGQRTRRRSSLSASLPAPTTATAAEPEPEPPAPESAKKRNAEEPKVCPYDGCPRAFGPACSRGGLKRATSHRRRSSATVNVVAEGADSQPQLNGSPPSSSTSSTSSVITGPWAPAPSSGQRPLSSPIKRRSISGGNKVTPASLAQAQGQQGPVVSPIRSQRPYVKPRDVQQQQGAAPLLVLGQTQNAVRRAHTRATAATQSVSRFFKLPVT